MAELEALQRTSLQLTSSLELPTVIEAIVENALTLVGATDCHIYLYDEASETFTFGSALWQDGRREAAVKAPRRDGFTATIARKGRPVVIDNVPSHPLYAAPEAQKWNLQAVAGFPLIWAGRVLGVLTIAFTEPHTFSPEELRVLGLLANQAAIAIENAQLFKAEQAQLRLAQTLQEVGALLTAQMSLEEVFERLFDLLARVVTCDSISIFVPVDENRVRLAAHRGFDDIEAVREFVANLEWQTLVERWGQKSVALISDTHEDENWFIAPGVAHIRAHVGAALVVQGRLIGELNVDSKEVGAYDAVTAETVAAFANQAAIAIENARLYQEIQTHAEDMEWRVEERTKELRLEQERSSAILRSVSDAIVMADLEMRIQYVNPAFTAMTGYTAAEAMGQHVSLVYQGSTTGHAARSIRQALAQGNTWQGEVVIQRKDGRTYDSALVITPMKDVEGNLLGYVSTNRDISQLKEMERTRRRFMSNVSHQLRTPAANMKLYAQLMQGGRRPERQEHYLQVLVEQADRLTALVLDILRMSELDSSQATMNWESLSLSSLLGDTITSYLGQAKDAGLTLIAAPLPSDLPVVKGDSVWLAQALHELVENAIIFTPSGGQVTIEAGIIEQEGQEWVTISVADSGPGISAEEQGKVFDRFFRGVLAESGHVPGTGLGLSYVQEVMNAHGGRVTLTSEVGQGSVFTLWLRSQA